MLELLLVPFLIGLAISGAAIPVIIRVADLKNLMDVPDSDRKLHQSSTPTLGGIAIFAGTLFAFSSYYDLKGGNDLKFMVPALVLLFFAGLKDDLLVLTAWKKLLVQIACAALITIWGGLRITNLWGILGLQEIPYVAGVLITVLAIVALINAFNLVDGINGLAGSLGLLAALCFGSWFALNGAGSLTILAFSLAGSLLGFLVFNFHRAKIFMGDTGSMAVGFIIAVLAIRFIELNRVSTTLEFPIRNAPAVSLAILSIPIFDMIRVFVIRIWSRRSPLSADRNHMHHYFVDRGFSHLATCLILVFANVISILIAIPLSDYRSAWASAVVLLYLSGFMLLIRVALRNRKKRTAKGVAVHI